MNPFQDTYYSRLSSWRQLRMIAGDSTVEDALVMIDRWWQQTPLVNHHLHPQDQGNWPDPWTMLSENIYCPLTRALGIVYTMKMSIDRSSTILIASDAMAEEHYLVQPSGANYLLNYYPDTVLSNTLSQFTVHRSIPVDLVLEKIK